MAEDKLGIVILMMEVKQINRITGKEAPVGRRSCCLAKNNHFNVLTSKLGLE